MINKKIVLLAGLLTGLVSMTSCGQTPAVSDQPAAAENSAARPATAGERRGKLGDPVPPLTVMEWIKGKPVQIGRGTNFYVVVFCNLTQANEFALTSLSSLQKRYQDKGLITLAISEETPEQLQDFVRLKGAEIDFAVAADQLAGRTTKNYLHAFGQIQVPRAFVVGTNGNLLWHGHPLSQGMGQVVDDLATGKYNLEQAQSSVTAREQMEQYLYLARRDDPRTAKLGRALLAIRANDAAGLCDLASKIATDPGLQTRDAALANDALDRAEQLSTTNATDIAVTHAMLLFQIGKPEDGLAKARQALASAQSQAAKDEVQMVISAMEAALSAAQTNQVAAPTNAAAGKP